MTEQPKPQTYNTPVQPQSPYEKYQLLKKYNLHIPTQSGVDQTPPGMLKVWTQYSNLDRNLTFWKPDSVARSNPTMPMAVWDNTKPFQSYWHNPKNVVDAYNFLSLQDDDYVPPTYLDPEFVKGMYGQLLAYNQTEDTSRWKSLPFGDEVSYYSYMQAGPDWWEKDPNNRGLFYTPRQTSGLQASMAQMQQIVDEVNASLLEDYKNEQISLEQYEQSVKYFSQYALSDEARALVGQGLTAEQLAAPFDPRDYGGLVVSGLLDQQGILDLDGKPAMEYKDMETWAQAMLTVVGAPEGMNMPEFNRGIAPAIQAGMSGIGLYTAIMTTATVVANITAPVAAGAAATGVGAPVAAGIQIAAIALGAFVGWQQYRAALTGEENMVSKVTGTIFNWLSEQSERVVGTATYMKEINEIVRDAETRGAAEEEVAKEVFDKYGITAEDFWNRLAESWTASRMYYESSGGQGGGDWFMDTVSTGVHAINPEWSSGLTTSPGEVWQLQKGMNEPTYLGLDSVETRAAIMKDIQALGDNPTKDDINYIMAMWTDALGMSGNMNNFAGQMVIDPINFLPTAVNKGIQLFADKKFKMAVAAGDMGAAQHWANMSSAAKIAIGNPLIEELPPGVQGGVEKFLSLVAGTDQQGLTPKWARGSLSPAQTFNLAAAFDAAGSVPKMFLETYEGMQSKGYAVPTGTSVDVVGAVAAGQASPAAKIFIASDGKYATVNFLDQTGKSIATEIVYSADNTTFTDPNQIFDQLKLTVEADSYNGSAKTQILDFINSPMEMREGVRVGMSDYLAKYKNDAGALGEALRTPVLIDPATGEVFEQGKLNLDSVQDGADTYTVTNADGTVTYTVDVKTDKVIRAVEGGAVKPLPADGYLVMPAKNQAWSDPYQSRVNMSAVNDIAAAFGMDKPYPESFFAGGGTPDPDALPSVMTGNKVVDFFTKMRDMTPESKIEIANAAISRVIMSAALMGQSDPEKFFSFFDYLANKPVEVDQQMKNYAMGDTVATAMLTLKDALADGSQFYTLRKGWEESTIRRVEVHNFARILDIPVENIVKMRADSIMKQLDAYNNKVAKTNPGQVIEMTLSDVKKLLAPYQGANAFPLTRDALVAKATFALVSDSELAAIKMFDPHSKSTLTQLSSLFKAAASLPLISANPGTWALNIFDNWLTMNQKVGSGCLLTTEKMIQTFVDDFGVDFRALVGDEFKVPVTIRTATTELNKILQPDNLITDIKKFISGLSSSETTPLAKLANAAGVQPEDLLVMMPSDIVSAAKGKKGFVHLTEAQVEKMVAPFIGENAKPLTISTKNPLATYGKIEQFFAVRSMMLAMQQVMRSMPLSDVAPELYSEMLSIGMTDRQIKAFQAKANQALNLGQIEDFFKTGEISYNPVPTEIIESAIDHLSGGDPAQKAVIESLLNIDGMRDEFTDILSKPRTPEEMNAIKHELYHMVHDKIQQTRVNNLAGDFATVTEDTSGHIGLLKNLNAYSDLEYRTHFAVNREWGSFWDKMDEALKSGMSTKNYQAYRAQMWEFYSQRTTQMWNDAYIVMQNGITAGMVKAGLGEDGDFFVNNLAQRIEIMKGVHETITKINQDNYDGVLPKNTDVAKLLDNAYSDYRKARDANQKAWVDKIIEVYDKRGVPPNGKTKEQVHNSLVGYMGEYLERDRRFRNEILDHRRAIESLDHGAKRKANKDFYENTYQAQAAEIHKFLTDDAYHEFNTIRETLYASKGKGQTKATKPKDMSQTELDIENKRATLNRNNTALEHRAMVEAQTKATYGTYNKHSFQNELFNATNLTASQQAAASAYFDAFDATVKRLSNGQLGFYESLGSIEAFDDVSLPQEKFISPTGEPYIAAMTYGEDGKFVLNFATQSADMASVFHEGSHAIVDTARRLYELGVFDDYEVILSDAGKTTINDFNSMDDIAKGRVYDDIADSMFKWQSDIETAKSMPAKLKSAFQTMATFFTDLINRLMGRYKDVELTDAVKEVYRSMFTQGDAVAKAERNAARIGKAREGIPFSVYGATDQVEFDLIPAVVEADTLTPSHNLGGHRNEGFPQEYQPRKYNLEFVREKAANLTPERLLNKPTDMSNGSPIIDEFGNVVAGNHRMGFLVEARENYPDQWAKYQQKLMESLGQYGLTEADLEGLNDPILVYKIANAGDVMEIVNQANAPTQQTMSALEYANRNAGFLNSKIVSELAFGENKTVDDVLSSAGAADIRREFINNLYDTERGPYLIGDTRVLSDKGREALKNALTAKVYGGTADGQLMLETIINSSSDFSKVLINAMVEAVPAMASVEALIEAGKLDPSYSIANKISTAVVEYTIWRNTSPDVRQPIDKAATTLFTQLSPEVVKMEQFFDNNITNARRIANLFNLYAEEARKISNITNAQDMFPGMEPDVPAVIKTAGDLLNSLLDTVNAEGQAVADIDMSSQVMSTLANNTINGWGERLRNYIEPTLRDFVSDVKKPTVPPDWANVEGLYDGTAKSYARIRKVLTQLLNGTDLDSIAHPEMRDIILAQANNKLLAESYGYRVFVGLEGSATADALMVQNVIAKLSAANQVEGTQVEIHKAVAEPLKSALSLLDDLKARNGDATAIADLEAAIAGTPVNPLNDGDILGGEPAPGQGGLFGQPGELTYRPGEEALPPVTPDPPQGPLTINQSSALDQLNNNELMLLVDEITDRLSKYMKDNPVFEMDKNLPPEALPYLQKQVDRWSGELDAKKLAAMEFGKSSRDHALIDYTRRRGIDGLMEFAYPYHFWYTHSVLEWAKHLVGKPQLAAAWSKYEELRRRNGMLGFPARMAGRVWIPTPWLPDYLGDQTFSNPFSRLMPLENMMQPWSLYTDLSEDLTYKTVSQINYMVRTKEITPEQGAAAIQSGSNEIWQDALAQVMLEDDGAMNDVMTLASQMMGVAPWWQNAYYFATGQKDKISVLPPTRFGQAISSFRSSDDPDAPKNLGTWAGDIFSYVGEVLKFPEEKTRELLGMSAYGEPGDYYVRLMLSSMLGDGYTNDVAEVEKQMIERKGNLWDEAKRRADVYLSVRLPGSLFLHQLNEFTQNPSPENASGIPNAFFLTMFPAGMIPEGEQVLRDMAPEYQQAWKEYNMGNKDALNDFEEKYPEYRVRRNMFKDDETLLKGFLVDQIWDKWTSIPSASRQLATQSLGDTFQSMFLDAKAYDRIDNETLAAWSYRLGGIVPETEETMGGINPAQSPVPRYTQEIEAEVTAFQDARAKRYPDYYWQQQIYWDTPKERREALERTMPSYFSYLKWRDEYYAAHPLVKQWADDAAERRSDGDDRLLAPTQELLGGGDSQASQSVLINFDDALKAELGKYYINGTPLSSGAKAELTRLWEAKGKPGGSLEQWINAILGLRR